MEMFKILVACHKPAVVKNDNVYTPIHVGRALSKCKDEMQWMIGDDTGDNISTKNPSYCELTALYWGWKNLSCEYIGTCHYRRYFDIDLSESNIKNIMSDCDIILPPLNVLNMAAADKLMHLTTRDDFYIMLMSIFKNYPEYKEGVVKYLFNYNRCSLYNMMITRKEVFDDYCEWMFSTLFEMEKHVKISNYTRLKRLYGFLSEYMLLLYCKQKGLRIKYIKTIQTDIKPDKSLKTIVRNTIKPILCDIGFFFLNHRYKNIPILPTTTNGFISDKIPYIEEDGKIVYPQ